MPHGCLYVVLSTDKPVVILARSVSTPLVVEAGANAVNRQNIKHIRNELLKRALSIEGPL